MTQYRCLFADPPWRFRDRGSRIAPEHAGHYATMTLADICAMGAALSILAEFDAHLWLCVPSALLLEGAGTDVARAWGYRPAQILTWVKPRFGMGHWMRNSTEHVILAVRGNLGPLARNVPTHLLADRTRHSAKPPELYQLVERVSPGPYLELFARAARPGWDSWGLQAPSETRVELPGLPLTAEEGSTTP